jgi:hypothetical protein
MGGWRKLSWNIHPSAPSKGEDDDDEDPKSERESSARRQASLPAEVSANPRATVLGGVPRLQSKRSTSTSWHNREDGGWREGVKIYVIK